jgi:hypothetical protein
VGKKALGRTYSSVFPEDLQALPAPKVPRLRAKMRVVDDNKVEAKVRYAIATRRD